MSHYVITLQKRKQIMCLNFNAERFGGERMLCNMHGLYWFTTGAWLLKQSQCGQAMDDKLSA